MFMSKKIKILECIRQGQIGGGESHLLSLVENLDRTRFDPVVLSFTDGPMITRLRTMNIDTSIIHTIRPFDITKWKSVLKFIKEKQIDIIHAHGTRANSNIIWAARKLGIPVIYTVHGWSFHKDQSFLTRRIRVFGEKYLTSKTDLNISVSESNKLSGQQLIKSFKSIVINNGIDQKKFDPRKQFKNIRSELNITESAVLLLFIARFTSHKQPLSLLSAFKNALHDNPNLHLLMVGEGDQKSEAEEWLKKEKLQEKVTFQPFREDIPDILATGDIYILPSLWEGLPIGLLEAMAMGKAVIATKVDGTIEIVEDKVNGYLINTDKLVSELCEAINTLSSNVELRNSYGSAAINTINERFNASVMTRKVEELYIEISEKNNVKN